jgi:hypothetical protein
VKIRLYLDEDVDVALAATIAATSPVGVLLRRLSNLCFHLSQEEMSNRLEFLGRWG